MLRTVATKIAHNSTIPALAGNSDLRPLQDLITAEKGILISLQRLSSDIAKASEALRLWGLGEGEDLGDTLSASANILTHYSSALAQYASHGHRMRDQLKAIRTREEALDDLRRRRKTVMSNADSAERKLSKMNPENKHLGQQQDTLTRLRNEIRSLDADIIAEEAALGDFKRAQIKTMMGLKFGGLLECSEKGTIAGEYGKLVIAEISEEITPPGVSRVVYYGHDQTENLIAEAHRRVSEVVLSTTVPLKVRQTIHGKPQPPYDNSPWAQNDSKPTSAKYLPTPEGIANGAFLDPSSTPLSFDTTAALSHSSSNYELGDRKGSADDFGTSAWSSSSSRFNTYPPKIGLNSDEGRNYSRSSDLPMPHSESAPFSVSVTDALSTVGDLPRNPDIRSSLVSAPPSYFGPEDIPPESFTRLDAGYQPTISGYSAASEESGHSTYQGEANASIHQGQVQNEISASTGPYRGHGDSIDVNFTTQPVPDTDGDTPRAENAFERLYGQNARSEEEEGALNAAAAREVGREMEALSFNRHRRNSLPQSVRSAVTDELRSNSPALGADDTRVLMPTAQELSYIPFGKQTISPQSSVERLQQSSVAPAQNQAYWSPVMQTRQNAPLYDSASSDRPLPSPTAARHHFPTAPPSPLLNTMSNFTPLPNSIRGSPEQPFISAPRVSKVSSTSSLPASGRTIPAAAFKRVIPRKGSESTVGEKRQYSISPSPQSQLQSPVIPLVRERANSESRPLPTPPQHNRDNDYSGGRFVTNLEDEW